MEQKLPIYRKNGDPHLSVFRTFSNIPGCYSCHKLGLFPEKTNAGDVDLCIM